MNKLENKYLKYKIKYTYLKNKIVYIGGGKGDNILIDFGKKDYRDTESLTGFRDSINAYLTDLTNKIRGIADKNKKEELQKSITFTIQSNTNTNPDPIISELRDIIDTFNTIGFWPIHYTIEDNKLILNITALSRFTTLLDKLILVGSDEPRENALLWPCPVSDKEICDTLKEKYNLMKSLFQKIFITINSDLDI